MENCEPVDIVVLGGGPTGLTAAWNLALDGFRVVVLEREQKCGGQSITFQKGEYRYDLGPHNIHSQRKSVISFLKKSLGDEFVQHDFSSEIYFQGKRIKYPFAGYDILRSIKPDTALSCAISFVWTRGKSFFIPSFSDDGTYQTWIVNRFGKRFFDIFFGPYSEKVWGISPKELSDIVAKKRITVTGIIELLHNIITKKEKYHPENSRLIENYYPENGIQAISDFLRKGIEENGGRIETGANVSKLLLEKNKISTIVYSKKGKECALPLSSESSRTAGQVISTIPLNEMILMINGDVPEPVISDADSLDFTSEVFLYLNINKPQVFGLPLFYFSEPVFPFNRIYDVGMFSRAMVPTGKTALCLEISCSFNDTYWQMSDREIFERCIEPLIKHKLIQKSDVESYHTQRLQHAYPRFRVGYQKRVHSILGFVEARLENLTTAGRQGFFSYANIDDAIWMGFEIAKNIRYKDRIHLTMEDLLPEYVTF